MVKQARKVIVFSRTPLFGQGLGKLLSTQKRIRFLGVAVTLAEVKALADQSHPDVIIVNQNDDGDLDGETLSKLLDITNQQVLSFTLADSDMIIYTRKRVPASIKELLNALTDVHRGQESLL